MQTRRKRSARARQPWGGCGVLTKSRKALAERFVKPRAIDEDAAALSVRDWHWLSGGPDDALPDEALAELDGIGAKAAAA